MSAPDPLVAALGPRWAAHAPAVRSAAETAGVWWDRVYGPAPRWTPADSRALRGVRRRLAALVAAIEALDGPAAWHVAIRDPRPALAAIDAHLALAARPWRPGTKRAWSGRHEAIARAALGVLHRAGMRLSASPTTRTWHVCRALGLPPLADPRPTLRRLLPRVKGGKSHAIRARKTL